MAKRAIKKAGGRGGRNAVANFPADRANKNSGQTGHAPMLFNSVPVRDAVTRLGAHDHFCLVYETAHEWNESTIPFFAEGLRKNEKCVFAGDAQAASEIKTGLRRRGLDVERAEGLKQMAFVSDPRDLTRGGKFDPELMIRFLIEETRQALGDGHPVMRVVAEMCWALAGHCSPELIMDYEARLQSMLLRHHPCSAVFHYDQNKFDPESTRAVVITHPLMLFNGYMYQNYNYVPPEDFLRKSRRPKLFGS